MLKTPKFWEKTGVLACALLPLAWVYFALGVVRKKLGKKFTIPGKFVLCVGNATVGGTGKTPTTMALVKALGASYSVCVLTKGYKRKGRGFVKVEKHHTALEIGDEPFMLAQITNVYLYSSVSDLIKNHEKIAQSVIIMDDGMQNNLTKNFVLMVVGRKGFYNGMIFPSGAMRESLSSALKKASAVLSLENVGLKTELAQFRAKQKVQCSAPMGRNYIGFSGLGDNEKFKICLQESGYKILHFLEFADHYFYSIKDLENIQSLARKMNCGIITTEKDWVKIPENLRENMFVFGNEYILESALIEKIMGEIDG